VNKKEGAVNEIDLEKHHQRQNIMLMIHWHHVHHHCCDAGRSQRQLQIRSRQAGAQREERQQNLQKWCADTEMLC
jgi:hypothetical protein